MHKIKHKLRHLLDINASLKSVSVPKRGKSIYLISYDISIGLCGAALVELMNMIKISVPGKVFNINSISQTTIILKERGKKKHSTKAIKVKELFLRISGDFEYMNV